MYKTRISEWGLRKNQKRSRKWTVLGNSKHPRDQERPHTHRLRAQVTGPSDFHRYLEDRGVTTGCIIVQQTELHAQQVVDCFNALTPLSPTPKPMTKTERILINIRDYFTGSFESGIWQSADPRMRCQSTKDQGDAMIHLRALSQQCTTACRLFDNNHFQKAGQTLISATSKIKEILSAEDPMTLTYLFAVVAHIHHQRRHEIALAILKQFSALAEILMGDRHPLHCICALLVSIHPSRFGETISKCSVSTGNHFERLVDPMCRSTLVSRGLYTRIVDASQEMVHRTGVLQNLLSKCEAVLGPFDVRTIEIRLALAFHHLENLDYVEAIKLDPSTLSPERNLPMWAHEADPDTEGLWIILDSDHIYDEGHLLKMSLSHLRRSLPASGLGPCDGRIPKWLKLLETRLLRQRHLSSIA